MSIQTKIALAAAVIVGAAGMAQASTVIHASTVAQASSGLGVTGTAGRSAPNPFPTQRPGSGAPSGMNPNNPQDMTNRSNPQDVTVPRARNPQDLTR
jgi:hypothetical protein